MFSRAVVASSSVGVIVFKIDDGDATHGHVKLRFERTKLERCFCFEVEVWERRNDIVYGFWIYGLEFVGAW